MSFLVSFLNDVTTTRVLAATTRSPVINLLHTADGGTTNLCVWNSTAVVDGRDKVTNAGQLADAPAETWIEYYWEKKTRRFIRNLEIPPITPALRSTATLYQKKVTVLRWMMGLISASRTKLMLPAAYENTVQSIKHSQARLFRSSGYDLGKMSECIFVWQYAEVYGISPREACDRLLLEVDFFEAELWKSEGIKMRYWNRILATKEIAQLDVLQDDFRREFYLNALV